VVRVRDRGCGIEPVDLPHIFEPFYRADAARSRETGGTGLGLAIVDQVVRAHRGRVDVDSAPGQGSTFTVYLPRA
jgi:signal transduction histidine kinase